MEDKKARCIECRKVGDDGGEERGQCRFAGANVGPCGGIIWWLLRLCISTHTLWLRAHLAAFAFHSRLLRRRPLPLSPRRSHQAHLALPSPLLLLVVARLGARLERMVARACRSS